MKIAYESHPISPARKKELREEGFKIVDARFKPTSKNTEKTVGSKQQNSGKRNGS